MLFVEGFNGCDRVLIQLPVDGLRDMHTPVQSEGLDRFKLVLKTIGELIKKIFKFLCSLKNRE